MKKLFRKNHWSSEDKMLAVVGVVAAVGVFAIIKQRKTAAATTATVAGLRGMRGLGAYFIDPRFTPIHGLGSYARVS